MDYCFYLDWKGLNPSEWAAWAQAVLSAIAIVAAARLASGQERRARRSKVDAYVAIISHADSEGRSTADHLKGAVGSSIASTTEDDWTRLCKVLDSVPFHDVPDFRLYGILRDTAKASAEIRDIYEPLLKSGNQVEVMHAICADGEAATLAQCYEDALKISDELLGLNLKGRFRYVVAHCRAMWKKVTALITPSGDTRSSLR